MILKFQGNSRVKRVDDSPINGNPTYVFNPKGMRSLLVSVSDDDQRKKTGWEHVYVTVLKEPSSCPTWLEMESVKRLVWGNDVPCMQWHAAESDYFHGPFANGNKSGIEVLHIWRPVDGDWSKLTDKGPDYGTEITDEVKSKLIEKIASLAKLSK